MGAAKRICSLLVLGFRSFAGPWTRTNVCGWIGLIVFILVLRWGFFELYSIPSGSMLPTLNGDPRFLRGDRVAVNKFLFGPRVPFTTNRIFPFWRPKRWDIVVFNNVDPEAEHPILIKRVVGLPGERIHISEGSIHVDGEAISPPPGLEGILYYTGGFPSGSFTERTLLEWALGRRIPVSLDTEEPSVARLVEELTALYPSVRNVDLPTLSEERRKALLDGVSHASFQVVTEWLGSQGGAMQRPVYGILENDAHSLVPEGHYLMLGDNSANSFDGRYFGWVPHKNLYGRAFAVAWPFANMKDLTGFTETFSGLFLLLGVPGFLVLWEISRSFFLFSWRVREGQPSLGLVPGDRVFINRVAFGLRLPFMKQPSLFQRAPRPGEAVAYIREGEDQHPDLFFGAIVAPDGAPGSLERCLVQSGESGPGESLEIGAGALVGRVVSIWWPLGKRRRVSSAA